MRTHLPKLMLLGVGGGLAAHLFSRGRSQMEPRGRDPLAADPSDPLQAMNEAGLAEDELGLDAMTMVEVEAGTIDAELEQAALDVDTPAETTIEAVEQSAHDVGDLYGGHTPRAQDPVHPDDDAAMENGQNWIEALETSAAENGPVPEQPLESIVDDEDVYAPPHASDSEDTPVADRGSGGPGGI